MKASRSTLNPHAESYIPFAKRGIKNENEGKKILPEVDDPKLKGLKADDDSFGSLSQIPDQIEDDFTDEDSEMELAYLQMIFPGLSDQSLLDVYNVNGGDLEAAIDMLHHLESADKLPDALDIEAAPQLATSSGEGSSINGLNATNESSSSSTTSDVKVAT